MTTRVIRNKTGSSKFGGSRRRHFLRTLLLCGSVMAVNHAPPNWAFSDRTRASATSSLLKHKARWDRALALWGSEGVRRMFRQSTTVEILRGQDWVGQGQRSEFVDCLIDAARDPRSAVSRGALIQLRRMNQRSLGPHLRGLKGLQRDFSASDLKRILLNQIIEDAEAS